jgi:hypothetical protein
LVAPAAEQRQFGGLGGKSPLERWGSQMARKLLLVAVFALLGCLGTGCGPTAEDSSPQPGEQASENGSSEDCAPAPDELSENIDPSDREVVAMARNCKVTCYGATAGGTTCSVFGFGSTSFLGGCTKACRRAYEDAQQNAAASGCIISYCTESCQ